MRLGPRSIACCYGWVGLICWADWLNHTLLRSRRHKGLCDRHEKVITNDVVIARFWLA